MNCSKNLIPTELQERDFWNMARRRILFQLLDKFGACKTVTKSDHASIKHLITNAQSLTPYQIETCNDVFSKLNGIGWDVAYLSLAHKKERPSSLPHTAVELELYEKMIRARNRLWTDELADRYSLDKVKKAIEIELAASYGLMPNHIRFFFENLPHSLGEEKLRVLPHPSCLDAPTCDFPLSSRMKLLTFHLNKFVDRISCQEANKKHVLHFKKNELTALAKHVVIKGVEPIIATQLQKNVLPVAPPRQPHSYTIEHTTANSYPFITLRQKSKASTSVQEIWVDAKNEKKKNPNPAYPSTSKIELPFSIAAISSLRSAQLRLRQALKVDGRYKSEKVDFHTFKSVFSGTKMKFLESLREYVTASKLNVDQRQAALQYIEELKSVTTPVDLALNIAFDQLIHRKNKSDTLFNYFSSVFFKGLFLYEECFDLRQWTDEDTDLFQSEFLFELENQYEPNTVKKTLTSFAYVINFAKKHHRIMDAFDTSQLSHGVLVLTNRNCIVGLHEFDQILKKVHRKGDDESLKLAVLMSLEFYAFMRTSEISQLTFNDVEVYGDEIMIRVRDSKTPSGKRSVPLHLIMPPVQRELLIELLEQRVRQHKITVNKYKNSKTKSGQARLEKLGLPTPAEPPKLKDWPLFAVDDGYGHDTAHKVVSLALTKIKDTAGPSADLYLLRHSGGSHLFSRWYASRYPNYISGLSDSTHWVYTKEGLAGLKEFFIEPPDVPLSPFNTSSTTHIIKLFGHANTNTFFKVYVHSFDVVASHAMRRIFEDEDNLQLNGKTITALIPNMRSRTSQRTIEDRSVRALVKAYL